MEYRTIRELCELVVDCPHSTPTWTKEGKIVLRNQHIKNGRIELSNPSYTDEEHYTQRTKRAQPISGDIVITREAPIGEVGMIPEGVKCCLGQRMVLLRANPEIIDKYYLLYGLQSRYVQHQISWSEGTGTTVSNLRIPHLEKLKIPYFPMKQQKMIAGILRAIEDKVTVNRMINDHLAA
ncbi:MAG: restriction endonuclease subunit S [Faecousia sp.]